MTDEQTTNVTVNGLQTEDKTPSAQEIPTNKQRSIERFTKHFSIGNEVKFSDADAQLLHVLGNPQNYTYLGIDPEFVNIKYEIDYDGKEFGIFRNRHQDDNNIKMINNGIEVGSFKDNNFDKYPIGIPVYESHDKTIEYDIYRLLAVKNDSSSGLNTAILEHTRPDGTKEVILWADGSKGFNNFKLKDFKTAKELYKDWAVSDIAIAFDNINLQTKQLREFALDYMCNSGRKIDRAVGISLAGIALSTLGYTQEFGDMEIHTYSGITTKELMKKAVKLWGDNGKNGANMVHHTVPREILMQYLKPYIGTGKLYMKGKSGNPNMIQHGAEIYINSDGKDATWHEVKIITPFPGWKIFSPLVTLEEAISVRKVKPTNTDEDDAQNQQDNNLPSWEKPLPGYEDPDVYWNGKKFTFEGELSDEEILKMDVHEKMRYYTKYLRHYYKKRLLTLAREQEQRDMLELIRQREIRKQQEAEEYWDPKDIEEEVEWYLSKEFDSVARELGYLK